MADRLATSLMASWTKGRPSGTSSLPAIDWREPSSWTRKLTAAAGVRLLKPPNVRSSVEGTNLPGSASRSARLAKLPGSPSAPPAIAMVKPPGRGVPAISGRRTRPGMLRSPLRPSFIMFERLLKLSSLPGVRRLTVAAWPSVKPSAPAPVMVSAASWPLSAR